MVAQLPAAGNNAAAGYKTVGKVLSEEGGVNSAGHRCGFGWILGAVG